MKVIARIQTDFTTKFGVPRQSGMIESLKASILFEPEYRNPDAFRGLEGFSHIWLIWEFSEAKREVYSPTVRPPRLGGNTRMGVFATRSPFRPNPIGLSCVKLEGIEYNLEFGPILHILGADLMDQTPIYDIKPYIPYTDCRKDAIGGFVDSLESYELEVDFPEKWLNIIPKDQQEGLLDVLAHDPRPSYHKDPERIYGFEFAGFDIRFKVQENKLFVISVNHVK